MSIEDFTLKLIFRPSFVGVVLESVQMKDDRTSEPKHILKPLCSFLLSPVARFHSLCTKEPLSHYSSH
ncbi:hypothetical protein S245_000376 [Arachis hypogaea]